MMPTLFRLLYGTGLRLGEALALEERDVNLKEKYLIIRQSKNGTERIVPLSESLANVCRQYRDGKRRRMRGQTKPDLFRVPFGSLSQPLRKDFSFFSFFVLKIISVSFID